MMRLIDNFWKMGMQKLKKCAFELVERLNPKICLRVPRLHGCDGQMKMMGVSSFKQAYHLYVFVNLEVM
jgi:hypothetical protein